MARQMFYTLEEAAERLGVDQQTIKDMAAEGKLQQFRDRDQLMFKRDEIEAQVSSSETTVDQPAYPDETTIDHPAQPGDTTIDQSMATSADTALGESAGPIPLADSDDTAGGSEIRLSADDTGMGGSSINSDAIGLADNESKSSRHQEDSRDATGVSVFDADEVEQADPTAQTQINQSAVGSEEAALDQVGSGSGLLDLTRESDDTSLGAAELLDEIYPGGEGESATGAAAASGTGSAIGSSGVMDATQGAATIFQPMDTGEQMDVDQSGETSGATLAAASVEAEPYDPAGSGFGAGMLLGVTVTLVLGLLIGVSAILGVQSPVTDMMTATSQSLAIWAGGLFVGSVVLGLVGGLVGKAAGGR